MKAATSQHKCSLEDNKMMKKTSRTKRKSLPSISSSKSKELSLTSSTQWAITFSLISEHSSWSHWWWTPCLSSFMDHVSPIRSSWVNRRNSFLWSTLLSIKLKWVITQAFINKLKPNWLFLTHAPSFCWPFVISKIPRKPQEHTRSFWMKSMFQTWLERWRTFTFSK